MATPEKEWILRPFHSFGPMSLASPTLQDFSATVGPPSAHFKVEGKGTLHEFKILPIRNLLAWFSNEYGFERFELRPFGFKVRIKDKTLQMPSNFNEVRDWLFTHDPLAHEKINDKFSVISCPMLGMLWDQTNSVLCIYAKSQWIHMLPPENYSAAALELLIEPEFAKQFRKLRKERPELLKANWSPVVAAGEGKGLTHCGYGGAPLLKPSEQTPKCKTCESPLSLDLQLNFAELPREARQIFGKRGLIQIFHCTSATCTEKIKKSGYHPLPFIGRYLQNPKNLVASSSKSSDLPAKSIVAWFKEFDGPEPEKLEEALGDEHPLLNQDSDEFLAVYDELFPYTTDKLGGYPGYIHEEEIPGCPKCKTEMRFVYQYAIDTKERFGHGNEGWIFLYQCPEHRKKFKLIFSSF